MSNFSNFSVDEILSLDKNDQQWIDYNEITNKMFNKAAMETYRQQEFDTYYKIVENIANLIRNNFPKINPLVVCGYLSSLIYKEGTWFYNDNKVFTYDDDKETDKLINDLEKKCDKIGFYSSSDLRTKIHELENSRVATIQNMDCLGAEVIRGRGCCRHTATFFRDVLRELGFEAYVIANSIRKSSCDVEMFLNAIDTEYEHSLSNTENADDGKCDENHMCVIFPFNGDYMLYDPTNTTLASISGYKAVDITEELEYVLSLPSLTRNEHMSYEDMLKLYEVLKKCNYVLFESSGFDIGLVGTKKYYTNSENVNYGIELFEKVCDVDAIRNHKHLLDDFIMHYKNMELYKGLEAQENIRKMI